MATKGKAEAGPEKTAARVKAAKVEKDPDREGCYLVDGEPQVEGWEPPKK